MIGAFSTYCNSKHTVAGSDADASRPARRCGPRTRDGLFRSTARQTNSATASPGQWVCRGCPWLVIGAFPVAIADQVAWDLIPGECFGNLPRNPVCGRIRGYVDPDKLT